MMTPKVFISYSWSSPAHQERVKTIADRLLSDGVDIIIDIYDLKEGNDKNAFMEKMVVDESITNVLVMCDSAYAH
ncbi:toll/interleukin-1 receptor domain-containing protein, partial [Escherichia coli]|nr:toll/interleukin-1 receptor domain-containing protein [Escherichia coli]